jgi:gamma-aminobutyric acid receptor subunit beta
VSPFDPFAKDLDLVKDQPRVGKLSEASVTDWDIDAVNARVEPVREEEPTDKRFLFEVKVSRRSTFYVWRVLLPMTLLVIASWTVFWFEPTNLQPQISTGLAILLSLVTFTYAIDFSLPKVAYLTFIDCYTLTSFAFVLAAIFTVSAIHVMLKMKGEKRALGLQRRARGMLPVAFGVAVSVIAVLSFR